MSALHYAYSAADDPVAGWYDKGVTQVREGNIDEAFTAFRQVLDMEPESAPAYNALGICFHFMGRKIDADTAYQNAARLDPRFASVQQRTLIDRLATLYRHKFLRPGMVTIDPTVDDDDDDDD